MSNYRPLLPVADYSALLDGLQKERNPWFAEVASFTALLHKSPLARH